MVPSLTNNDDERPAVYVIGRPIYEIGDRIGCKRYVGDPPIISSSIKI